jgi:predicted hotdog family 3-hydroxylacyl-ACP dehydratase
LLVVNFSLQSNRAVSIVGRIPEDHPLVQSGRASSLLATELAAQATGILVGLASRKPGFSPGHGYLVSLNKVRLLVPHLPVEVDLVADVRLEAQVGNLSIAQFEVKQEGLRVANGQVGLYVPIQEQA